MNDIGNKNIWKRYFIVLLLVTAGIKALLLGIPEITPQGAYYWQYSRHLDWGYFDHPGMTAYTIRFFTAILGNNLYGIRMNSLVYSIGFTILLFLFVRRLYNDRTAFWTCFAMSLTPLGIVGGIFVTPDPALIFFWTTSIYFFHRAWKEEKGIFYALAGVAAGLAMLSKYTGVFLFVGFGIMLFATERGRKALRTPWPWLGLVLSVIFFMPQLYWNYRNDWASFAFQAIGRAEKVRRLRLDYFFGYLGSQIMVVTPFIYGGMLYYLFKRIKKALSEKEDTLFLLSFSLPMILFFSFVGLISWVKVNWLAPAYLTGVALFFGEILKSSSKKYFRLSLWICLLLGLVLLVQLAFSPIAASGEMMTVAGWRVLAEKVENEKLRLPEPDQVFIFGWEYKIPSVLSFYLPGQPDNYGNDVLGEPLLQYQYWFDPDPLVGHDALFVVDKRQKFVPPGTTKREWWDMGIPDRREVVVDYLGNFFDTVEWSGDFLPEYRGKEISRFSIYRCHNYRGPKPVSP